MRDIPKTGLAERVNNERNVEGHKAQVDQDQPVRQISKYTVQSFSDRRFGQCPCESDHNPQRNRNFTGVEYFHSITASASGGGQVADVPALCFGRRNLVGAHGGLPDSATRHFTWSLRGHEDVDGDGERDFSANVTQPFPRQSGHRSVAHPNQRVSSMSIS